MMKQTGLTLVELMISMVLGLLLTAGVLTLFIQSQQSYAATRDVAILDQNAQVLVDMVERDLQRVGYAFGCRPDKAANIVNVVETKDGNAVPSIVSNNKIQGFRVAAGSTASPALLQQMNATAYNEIKPDTDLFLVMAGDPSKQGRVAAREQNSGRANFTAVFEDGVPDLKGQLIYMVSPDCTQVSQFVQVSETENDGRTVSKIVHAKGNAGGEINNCEIDIVGEFPDCETGDKTQLSSEDFPPGGTIMVVEYIGYAVNRDNQLIRINTTATNSTTPLLDNVTNFELEYGVSSGSAVNNGVRSVNFYATAEEISASTTVGWQDVIAIRMNFTLQGQTKVKGQPFTKTYSRLMTMRNEVIE